MKGHKVSHVLWGVNKTHACVYEECCRNIVRSDALGHLIYIITAKAWFILVSNTDPFPQRPGMSKDAWVGQSAGGCEVLGAR